MKHTFVPKGVCSKRYDIDLEDGIIKSIAVTGGCNGNLQGISTLITGQRAEDMIRKLRGISCGGRGTSCPDQISYALEEALESEKAGKKEGETK